MLTANNITHSYGIHRGIEDVSFTIPAGAVVGLLGPNGAGKTTTMNILSGFIAPQSGEVTVAGLPLSKKPLDARRHMGYLPENPPLYKDMTVDEFLRFVFNLKGVSAVSVKDHLHEIADLAGITDVYKRLIGHLSKGYCQRVGLAASLVGDPDILILDEPTAGLDPRQMVEMRSLIQMLGETRTVLLSTHILSEVSEVCSRILVISRGKIAADDTPEELSMKYSSLEQAFLTLTEEEGGEAR